MIDEEIQQSFRICLTETTIEECRKCAYHEQYPYKCQFRMHKDAMNLLERLQSENAALRERLDKAGEIPNMFNKDIVTILYDKYYDKYKIPNLYNAKVVGIGVDTYALYEGKIDIIMAALCENGDVHFLHGRQYKKKWFLREDRPEAESRLEELKGGME